MMKTKALISISGQHFLAIKNISNTQIQSIAHTQIQADKKNSSRELIKLEAVLLWMTNTLQPWKQNPKSHELNQEHWNIERMY